MNNMDIWICIIYIYIIYKLNRKKPGCNMFPLKSLYSKYQCYKMFVKELLEGKSEIKVLNMYEY